MTRDRSLPCRVALALFLLLFTLPDHPAVAAEGEMRWGLHVTLATKWLALAETEAFSTPFMVLYGVHDALVKPMPAGLSTPSLAESWQESKDHLTYTLGVAPLVPVECGRSLDPWGGARWVVSRRLSSSATAARTQPGRRPSIRT